jgi:hypothetical protein
VAKKRRPEFRCWDFIVVGTDVKGTPDLERKESQGRPFGQIMDAGGVRVWVRTWAEIIDDAQHRLKFVKEKLDYSPDAKQALEYLHATHAKYLPDEIDQGEITVARTPESSGNPDRKSPAA